MSVSVVCVGDNCIDYYLPPLDYKFVGGNALNVAVYLRRSGVSSAYVGILGNDIEGKLILNMLQAQGVDTSHVKSIPGITAQTHIRLNPKGDREFVYESSGPAGKLLFDEDLLSFLFQHKLIHNTWLGKTEAQLPVFKQNQNTLISLDYGERYTPDFMERTIQYVDLAFFSLPEDKFEIAEEYAIQMHGLGPQLVIITMGNKGSLGYNGSSYFQPAFLTDVVDTLGAGDAYVGTFLANWLNGKSLNESMLQASTIAAQTCTHYGAWKQNNIKIGDSID